MPNLDEKTTKVLNLTVLQRIDPCVEEILITAAHVTFYKFHIDTSSWSRKDVEGSLFVVKRNTQPRFKFIVMNRRNTDNLVENLLGDFEYELQVPYLLYRNASQEVNGIWFYNARECRDVANLFTRILNAYSKVPTQSKVSSTESEFEELEAVPTLAVMDGPLEPQSSTAANVGDSSDDPSFVNFFNASMNLGASPGSAVTGQPYHSAATVFPTCQPLSVALPTLPTASPSHDLSASAHIMSLLEVQRTADLVKPSSFFGPPSPSSSPLGLPTISSPPSPHGNLQRPYGVPLLQPFPPPTPYGVPLLQPFPPPTPPPSLTPSSPISREEVRVALQMLVQDNQFIDTVYQAMVNAHQSR